MTDEPTTETLFVPAAAMVVMREHYDALMACACFVRDVIGAGNEGKPVDAIALGLHHGILDIDSDDDVTMGAATAQILDYIADLEATYAQETEVEITKEPEPA
jgi:hypothetical protein